MKAGWQMKCLGDVTKVGAGNSAPQGEQLFKDGMYPFFRTSDAGRIRLGDIYESSDYLNEEGIKGLRLFPAGTILFPKSGASTFLNHRVMLGVDGYVSSHLATIVADNAKIHERFLFYFLTTISAQDLVQDHAYPSLNLPIISAIEVPLPPLPEQQRIVTILDEAFAGIATATANAEKNLANARELFNNTKREVFENLESVEIKVPLASVCNEMFAGGDAPKDNFSIKKTEKFNIQIIANAVKNNGLYGFTDLTRVSEPSITIAARGSGTGHTEIRYEPFFPIVRLIVLTPNTSLTTLEFLKLAIQNLVILSNGSAIPQLTIPMIKEYSISLPSILKQQAIVQKLDELSSETKKLEAIYQQKLIALDELKKSILNQAFSGQLQ